LLPVSSPQLAPAQQPSKNSNAIPRRITATKTAGKIGKQRKKAAILPNNKRPANARRQIVITRTNQGTCITNFIGTEHPPQLRNTASFGVEDCGS
jgi:hypothetical protein